MAVSGTSITIVAALATATLLAGVGEQSGTNLQRPPTWKARYDEAGSAERTQLVMRPGWHINPGAAGIFWDPGRFAAGNFSVTSTIFLFPAGQGDPPSRVDAPYGLLLGGGNLDGASPAYTTFLLRNDGQFQVASRAGSTTSDVVPWTGHKTIAVWETGGSGTARNVLAVDVTAETVTFFVNDEQVASVPRSGLPIEGTVGLRAGEGLSLHITDLVIGPNRR